ncbi:MAG: hypothetical protein J4F44_00770 [Acidimicrobiia bacterium]|nr:hypothetical protein [Acidimicrobiia bacterium]
MNDHRLPPDEAASAFLDGELGAAEAEAVRRHSRLAARARALRRAADAVGEDVAPPPGAADAAIEAALADFDARRTSAAEPAQRRPRSLSVITGVAAAVAIGFIVAAAVGLFAGRGAVEDADTAAAPAPQAAAAPAPAPAAEPPPPAPEAEPAPPPEAQPAADEAMALAPPATTAAVEPFATAPATTAPLPLDPPEVAAAEPGAALADAQAQAEAAQAEAAEARAAATDTPAAEAAAAVAEPAPPPEAEPAPPAEDEMEALDDTGPSPTLGADPAPEEACAGVIGDRTVELRLTLGGAPILVLGTSDGSLTALDGTTCAEIPPPDGTEMVADQAPDGCAAALGDGRVELRLTFTGTRILVVRTSDGPLTALDGTTCGGIPAG